jgi:hypothetical protein
MEGDLAKDDTGCEYQRILQAKFWYATRRPLISLARPTFKRYPLASLHCSHWLPVPIGDKKRDECGLA